jgi:hypothetical protein
MTILALPAAFQVSQASFGMAYNDRIEQRRSGAEDIFSDGAPRWMASFVVEADVEALAKWRAFLQRMRGAKGLAYVHDATDTAPRGGARTAAALIAAGSAAATWVSAGNTSGAWENASAAAITWRLRPPAPSVTALRLAEPARTGADSVVVEGLWPSRDGVILPGEYIQVGHWLYTATHSSISGPDGRALVQLVPDLRRAAPKHSAVNLEMAATVMRLDQPSVMWSRATRSRRYPFTVTFREVLPSEGVPY